MKVKKLLGKNGHKVNIISPDALVSDAMKLMSKKEINALAVSENGKMVFTLCPFLPNNFFTFIIISS